MKHDSLPIIYIMFLIRVFYICSAPGSKRSGALFIGRHCDFPACRVVCRYLKVGDPILCDNFCCDLIRILYRYSSAVAQAAAGRGDRGSASGDTSNFTVLDADYPGGAGSPNHGIRRVLYGCCERRSLAYEDLLCFGGNRYRGNGIFYIYRYCNIPVSAKNAAAVIS